MNVLASAAGTLRLVNYAIDFGIIVIFAGMMLCFARLLRGPHLADRAVAVDTLLVHLMALVILFMLRSRSLLLFDGALILALLSFVATTAVAQYILRPHIRPGKQPPAKVAEEKE
jgi:multisubunit Na+/H+ antiporter MnhF subunit